MSQPQPQRPDPGALVRIIHAAGHRFLWHVVDPRTSRVLAAGTNEQLLRAECHAHGWIAEDTRQL